MDDSLAADFRDFVRTRTPALLRSAYLLTGDRHAAEDLVQDALARTHLAVRRLADAGHFEAYARTALYHLSVSRWRRRRREVVRDDVTGLTRPTVDHAAGVSLRVSLDAALQRLTRNQRAVLVLRFFEDCSEVQAAQMLGVSVGTVKSQTSKALARLRELAPELLEPITVKGAGR